MSGYDYTKWKQTRLSFYLGHISFLISNLHFPVLFGLWVIRGHSVFIG